MTKYLKKRARTKESIIKSTLVLAHIKGLLNVKISDIVRQSKINRKTFYRYFTDQPELIKSIEDNVLKSIKQAHVKLYQYQKLNVIFLKAKSRQKLLLFLNTFGKNRRIILLLTGKHGDPLFSYRMIRLLKTMLLNAQNHFSMQINEKQRPLFIHYFAFGIYGLIQFWLKHYYEYSKEDIVNFVYTINKDIIKQFSK